MGTLLVYSIKAAACLALLFGGYRLLLHRETFYRSNRFALLGMLVLSFLLPWVGMWWMVEPISGGEMPVWTMLPVTVVSSEGEGGPVSVAPSVSWQLVVVVLYSLGCAGLLLKEVFGLCQLFRMLRSGRRKRLSDGLWLVLHCRETAPFSWWNYVVMSEADFERHGAYILAHERGHIHSRHSWDLLVVGLCAVVQWFNPFIWLLKRELHDVHEFEADATVLSQGLDARQYQLLLIEKAVGTRRYSMANSLNHSSLKKRITMMKKGKSNPWARAKYLYVLPLAAVAVTAFARQEIVAPLSSISDAKITDLVAFVKVKDVEKGRIAVADTVSPKQSDRPVYHIVEQMAEFPGGSEALCKYLAKSTKYPAKAQESGQTGRVVVRFTVARDGMVVNPEVVCSAAPLLDAEALRVVKQMPRWIPGKQRGKAVDVYHAIPISFYLDNVPPSAQLAENEVVVVGYSKAPGRKPLESNTTNPLFVVDGKETPVAVFNKLAPKDIASITVLKEKTAVGLYGDKGKDGVVVVTTKRKEDSLTMWKGKDNVLILCNGNRISGDVLQALSPDKIESIEVLKDSVSRAKYQAVDKEGVILVNLKK